MKSYSYNKESVVGRRMFQLLDSRYNNSRVDANYRAKAFNTEIVSSAVECRVNKIKFIIPGNVSGIKRPQIHVDGDIEKARGPFTDSVTLIDFTHDHQELPLSYVQSIDDDTMSVLIDAGFYSDPRFEDLLSKLMSGEVFSADGDLVTNIMDLGDSGEELPVLLVEPLNEVHINDGLTHASTLQTLIKHSAKLAIRLKREGVNIDELIYSDKDFIDREIFIDDDFEDVVEKRHVERTLESDKIAITSELLDEEIDVTDMLKGSLSFDYDNIDDRIREIKEVQNDDSYDGSLSAVASVDQTVDVFDYDIPGAVENSYESEFDDFREVDAFVDDDDLEI